MFADTNMAHYYDSTGKLIHYARGVNGLHSSPVDGTFQFEQTPLVVTDLTDSILLPRSINVLNGFFAVLGANGSSGKVLVKPFGKSISSTSDWVNLSAPFGSNRIPQGLYKSPGNNAVYIPTFNSTGLLRIYKGTLSTWPSAFTAITVTPVAGMTSSLFGFGVKHDGSTMLAVGDGTEVYRSTNEGLSWTQVHTLAQSVSINASISYCRSIKRWSIVTTSGEAIYSDDDGVTWTSSVLIGTTVTSSSSNAFCLKRSVKATEDGEVLLGFSHKTRLFVSKDGGKSWAPIGPIVDPYANRADAYGQGTNLNTLHDGTRVWLYETYPAGSYDVAVYRSASFGFDAGGGLDNPV